MAITSYLYQILITLKKKELTSSGKTNSILEIGEQNWYGDVSFQDLMKVVDSYCNEKNKAILNYLHNIFILIKTYLQKKKNGGI